VSLPLTLICIRAMMFRVLMFLMLIWGSMLVLCSNIATIKLHRMVPMPFYLALPCITSISLIAILILLFQMMTNSHEKSCEFIRKFYLINIHHKYWSKVAQYPFHFDVGELFIAKKSTQVTCMQCIYLILLLILCVFWIDKWSKSKEN